MQCRVQLCAAVLLALVGRAAAAAAVPPEGDGAAGVAWHGPSPRRDGGTSSPYAARPRARRRLAYPGGRQRPEDRECRLKTLLLRVRDLGLGYDSEESVLFKYCGGGCPRSRTNHDLTLSRLLQKGDLPSLLEEKVFGGPCCRPTHYEDVAFLDDSHRWHTVEELSAAACSCVG